jgi:hypothetical protein
VDGCFGAWTGIAIGESERPVWVDNGLSAISSRTAAAGGFRSFADTRANGQVAPIPAVRATLIETRELTRSVIHSPRRQWLVTRGRPFAEQIFLLEICKQIRKQM